MVAVMCCYIRQHGLFAIQEGRTPLDFASMKGHVAVVNELLQHNADVSICDEVHTIQCTIVLNYIRESVTLSVVSNLPIKCPGGFSRLSMYIGMALICPFSLNKNNGSEISNAAVISLFRCTACSMSVPIHSKALKVTTMIHGRQYCHRILLIQK